LSPSLLAELGTVQINDQEGSWMKMLNSLLFSRIISVRVLFLQTFCENKQRFFKIMNLPYP